MTFNRQELDLLFEAVEQWEQSAYGIGIIPIVMGIAGDPESDEFRSECKQRVEAYREKVAADVRNRKERGVLIRAKLINIRDSMDVDQLFNESAAVPK